MLCLLIHPVLSDGQVTEAVQCLIATLGGDGSVQDGGNARIGVASAATTNWQRYVQVLGDRVFP